MSADFKNPYLHEEEDKNSLILTAAAKGAGLALVTGGLIAFTGARHSKAYQTLSRPMKMFLLGSGKELSSSPLCSLQSLIAILEDVIQLWLLVPAITPVTKALTVSQHPTFVSFYFLRCRCHLDSLC